MLHAFANWPAQRARAAAGIGSLDPPTLNGTNLAVLLWERIVIYFARRSLRWAATSPPPTRASTALWKRTLPPTKPAGSHWQPCRSSAGGGRSQSG
jgi:hypothetical protein